MGKLQLQRQGPLVHLQPVLRRLLLRGLHQPPAPLPLPPERLLLLSCCRRAVSSCKLGPCCRASGAKLRVVLLVLALHHILDRWPDEPVLVEVVAPDHHAQELGARALRLLHELARKRMGLPL